MFKTKFTATYAVYDGAVKVTVTPTVENSRYMKALAVYYNINDERFPRFQKQRPQAFVGIARYKDGDVNNVENAKKIARKKALRQMYSFYYNVMKEMKANFEMRISELDYDLANLSDSKLEMTRQIKELIK
jgi:exopolysaccharide biosynthesis protein